MRLTKNFSLAELTRSSTADRRDINNTPSVAQVEALKLVCEKVLQPLRDHLGVPIKVTSGYRSVSLNRAIGGSGRSQHCKGEAVDFKVPGKSHYEVCKWLERNLNYDQLIYEFGESGWIHVSYSASSMRNQELSAVKRSGRTRYLAGIRK